MKGMNSTMINRNYILTLSARSICVLFILALILYPVLLHYRSSQLAPSPIPTLRILLIPLDSRPPCRDFPGQLTSIANFQTITPPAGYLDNYRQQADTAALKDWLLSVGPSADAVVISIDSLIHGSLLASRIPTGTRDDAERTLQLIEQFHQQNPLIPIYVFNIIPRLYIADTPENQPYIHAMAELSILTDKLAQTANDTDSQRLAQLRSSIPVSIQQKYEDMYATNTWLGQRLLELAAQGTLRHVVLGQDDAHPYGMANMVKRTLQNWLALHPQVKNVTITRGTDEVAATLAAKFVTDYAGLTPRIFVCYSWPGAPAVLMPYMPISVDQTVQEKIVLVNGQRVSTPDEADFILFVHIGTQDTPPMVLEKAVLEIKKYQQQGYPVSIVDLTSAYDPTKNLFPYLEKSRINFVGLISYAGWNTSSNSIGTAVAHATIYTYAKQNNVLIEEDHYAFLFQRILDDWYFQKQVQPRLNKFLSMIGISATNLGTNYASVNKAAQKQLSPLANSLYARHFAGKTGAYRLITSYDVFSQLPWSRTFEVQVNSSFKTVGSNRD